MRTYDLARLRKDDTHTCHHGKDETGRSAEIESYIQYTNTWINRNLPRGGLAGKKVIDLGCDYGFQLQDMRDRFEINQDLSFGVDMYLNKAMDLTVKVVELEIESFTSLLTPQLDSSAFIAADLVVFNHTLEHFTYPWRMIPEKSDYVYVDYVFIGVPVHGTPWDLWEGHISTWDLESLVGFMKPFGWQLINHKYECFRGENVELWTMWENI